LTGYANGQHAPLSRNFAIRYRGSQQELLTVSYNNRQSFGLTFALMAVMCLPAAAIERGVMIREGVIYVSPSTDSAKLSNIGRGREVAVLERSPGWVEVVGTVAISPDPDSEDDRNVTGWMVDKGVITTATPDGDKIIYGEAFDCELEASHRDGRAGADLDAMRLYARLAEYFPQSPLAAEAAYRAADIRWQIEAADAASRPSAKMRDPQLHHQIDEDYMRKVIKKYPGTKWADLAAYHLIDNKLCGDWEAQAKCPEQEAAMYMKYAEEHPQSPKAPEALYKAAWRYSALVAIYGANHEPKKADEASERSLNASKKLVAQYPNDVDWSSRAERLIYMVTNKLPTFGITVE
jgi:outer membrane protein assembly factor BamD (BamD/ComL family)